MSKARTLLVATLVLFVSTFFLVPAMSAQSTPHNGSLAVPIAGTFAPSATPGPLSSLGSGTVNGILNITRFANQNGQLVALGTFSGTVTNAAGQVQNIVTNVAIPITQATGACPILSLTLGPLHLDLLGLVIDLNQVNLNITAQPGSGNLLGNLLCAVANLLNNGGPLTGIANLLNQILAAL